MAGDMIRLAKDPEGREVLFNVPWNGEWPPPEVLEPFGEGWGKWARQAYSKLPADFSEHVMRGAIYTAIAEEAVPCEAPFAVNGHGSPRRGEMVAALSVVAKALLAPLRELHGMHLCEAPMCIREGCCEACHATSPCPTVRLLDAIEAEVS